MITTTTHSIEGKSITEYYGIVSGEAIIGSNFVKDFFASIRDVLGGRSGSYEKVLREAKEIAIKELIQAGNKKGANAIVGVDLDYETIGEMLMVTASGTAVKIQ